MPRTIYWRTALTGGGAGAIDAIDGDDLNDGEICYDNVSSTIYIYILDAYSGLEESSPDVIVPDTNPGSKCWVLQQLCSSINDYSSTMTDNETFTESGNEKIYFLDPNGAARNFNPSGDFRTGYKICVVNTGDAYNIIFDSSGISVSIPPGEKKQFYYTGDTWI